MDNMPRITHKPSLDRKKGPALVIHPEIEQNHASDKLPIDQQAARRPTRRDFLWGMLVVTTAFLWGILWHYQGWQTFRLKNHDMIVYHENADRLLQNGSLPVLGDLSSYLSYSPPGTSYWVALGKLVTDDPRWQEFLPEMILFFLELVFAWLLMDAVLGRTVAAASVIGIGVSRMGFLGLWPIGHSAYVLGAAYFLLLWARDRRRWALMAAIAWFGFGLLVDMAILPAAFLFPLVWLVYRPPWKTVWLAAGLAIAIFLWFPYLHWESQHGFRDVVSLVNWEGSLRIGPRYEHARRLLLRVIAGRIRNMVRCVCRLGLRGPGNAVYRSQRHRHRSSVALPILPPGHKPGSEFRRKFLRLGRIARRQFRALDPVDGWRNRFGLCGFALVHPLGKLDQRTTEAAWYRAKSRRGGLGLFVGVVFRVPTGCSELAGRSWEGRLAGDRCAGDLFSPCIYA